jgi:anti-sigma regulatory factor (Ser/Thr protein kinase)
LSPHDGGVTHPEATTLGSSHPAVPVAGEISLTLPPEPTSCALARRAVRAFCRTQRLPDLADDAALLTSELVGNAVDHAAGTIRLVAQCDDGHVTVRVADDNTRIGFAPHDGAEQQGDRVRRLFVVARLAGEWGAAHQEDGKSVWFRLP